MFPGQYLITSDAGLMNPAELVSFERLKAFGNVPIDPREPRYAEPFRRSVGALAQKLPPNCRVVLLGSIATNKYSDILIESFGGRLIFPCEFVGRGDMSRGEYCCAPSRQARSLSIFRCRGLKVAVASELQSWPKITDGTMLLDPKLAVGPV